MKVLVVGSEGYLGRATCKELRCRGHEVLRLDAGMHGPVEEGVLWSRGDLSRHPELAYDAVIWLGAVAHDPAGVVGKDLMNEWVWRKPVRAAYWCAQRGILFVVASSLSVFSDVGHYPAAKRALEHALTAIPRWERFVSVLRFGTLYGAVPGAHPAGYRPHLFLNRMVLDGVRGKPIQVSCPAARRPVLHVVQAAASLVLCVEADRPRGVVMSLYETCGSLLQFAELVQEVVKETPRIEVGSMPHDGRDYGWGEFSGSWFAAGVKQLARWTSGHLAEIEAIEETFPGNMYRFLGVGGEDAGVQPAADQAR